MAFTVSNFKSALSKAGGGARPALYKITMDHSKNTGLSFTSDESILCKAASIPPANIAPLAVNYHGRAYKWTGMRTFDNWTTTILNDESFSMRNKISEWMRMLAGKMDGERNSAFGDPTGTGGTYWDGVATVQQLTTNGQTAQTYKFHNLWPTELAEIAVDWSSDMIQEYTVTWCYDYWSAGAGSNSKNLVSDAA
tara:strand:+ start:35 stop:619 length:585 start_codon:yes stop_codon:yes gene_type:complete